MRWKGATALLAAAVTSGCTVVRVTGAATPQLRAGVLRLAPAADATLVTYQATGFGLVPGHAA